MEAHVAGDGAPVPDLARKLLGDATARIGSTLDLVQTAREAVDVAVPRFADAAAVFVPERLLAADELASCRPGDTVVVRQLAARFAAQFAGLHGAGAQDLLKPNQTVVFGQDTPYARAMATRRPIVFDCLDGETAEKLGRRPEVSRIASTFSSFMAAPLTARGTVVGCATFGRTRARSAFARGDELLATELGARAGVCIDNALLYHRERRTALALQRSMLPAQPPQVPDGIEVVHKYLPVGDNIVGGDWHDIVPLSGSRAALIVGDAMGHGPEAAVVMVQLRAAARALADLELPPQEVLYRLDRLAAGLPGAPFATCVYTVIDPPDRSCVIVQAGHLPPVLAAPGDATRLLDLPPGLPLGLGSESFQPCRIGLPPGAALALYTDGLVESRSRPLGEGLAVLRCTLGPALEGEKTLGSACESIVQELRQHRDDDLTLVLARPR